MKNDCNKNQLITWMLLLAMLFTSLLSPSVFAAKQDRVSPSAPRYLRATSIDTTSVTLEWNSSSDNVGVDSYDIYRNNEKVGNTNSTTYQTTGLLPATTYKFYVKAKDSVGNISKSSNVLTITTLQLMPEPTPEPTPVPTPEPTIQPTVEPSPTPTLEPTPVPQPNIKYVVGYYAAWSSYSGFTPDKIDANKLTHINYAFANIGSDLRIALGYPDIDLANINKLNALKQTNPNLKTLIAVGGWTWSGKFSDVALTDESRTAFAESCVDFIIKYGFDGIDIDWEYPVSGGLASNIKRPEDKQNFTLLMQKLREKLDTREAIDGREYLLSFAGASGTWYINNTELSKLNEYVDFANIMTYDIHGTWDKYTDFNAPLYNNSDISPQYKWSIDSSINAWIKAGFSTEKLVMGIPFYGYKYNSVFNANRGLYQIYSGGSSISYGNIAANYLNAPGYTRYFHTESMVPWLFNGSTFISYEDEQSIEYKAQYIKSKGLGGAMIWELSQDPNKVLLNSLSNHLE
jgi:chitinase